jgi:hypothetical protein
MKVVFGFVDVMIATIRLAAFAGETPVAEHNSKPTVAEQILAKE